MIYDFLYFIFYCLIVKNNQEKNINERASFLFSSTISIYLASIFFYAIIYFRIERLNPIWTSFILFVIATLIVFLNSYYFIKIKRYEKIVKRFSFYSKNKKRIFAIIAAFLFIFSLFIMLYNGKQLSRFYHPY
jgi:hypothetical protein